MNTTTHNCDFIPDINHKSPAVAIPEKYVIDEQDPPLSRAYKVGHNNCVDMMRVMNSYEERK